MEIRLVNEDERYGFIPSHVRSRERQAKVVAIVERMLTELALTTAERYQLRKTLWQYFEDEISSQSIELSYEVLP